jgi:hypothetical protein
MGAQVLFIQSDEDASEGTECRGECEDRDLLNCGTAFFITTW